jgi:membrane dipeptidase
MIKWDAHLCLPMHADADFSAVERLHQAGVNHVSINVGADMYSLSQVMSILAGFRASVALHADRFMLAGTVQEVMLARELGKISISFDLEGAMPLQDQPDMVALFAALGVRQIHFAYNRNNSVADGCHDVERGLTALGRRMVQAVNDAGMLLDCSHTGRRCSLEIMAASRHPVIFSHANPLALAEHGRNITDEQIRACAATEGLVGISGLSFFLGCDKPDAEAVARHVAYVANLVGVEHVGIGLDICLQQEGLNDAPWGGFEPGHWWPREAGYAPDAPPTFTPIETWKYLPQALREVGMSAAEADLVMGGNMLRVAQQVWPKAGPDHSVVS